MKENKTFSEHLLDYRVFSISACIFISWMFYEITMWIVAFGLDEISALSTGAGVAITGIYTSIAASYKFVYEFAKSGGHNSNKRYKEE